MDIGILQEILGRGFVILFCLLIMLNPPIEYKSPDTRPTKPYPREVDYMVMGERRDSILYHLPKK